MAAIAFDTLKAARRLKAAGVPEAQAEAQAELMAEAFVFNMDALVTRDYLEQCFENQNLRLDQFEQRINRRFDEQEQRFTQRFEKQDQRFEKQDQRFKQQDLRFDKQDLRLDKQDQRFDRIEARLTDHDLQFADIRGELKLHRWMLAIIAASTVIPALQKLFALLSGW